MYVKGQFFAILNLSISFISAILLCVLVILIFSACSPLTSINHSVKTNYTPDYNNFTGPIAEPYQEELKQQKDGALIKEMLRFSIAKNCPFTYIKAFP